MMVIKATRDDIEEIGPFQIFTLILSVYVLLALLFEHLFLPQEDVKQILRMADHFVCFFFLLDFSIRFYRAKSKWAFMKWGWIDLLSSIPMLDAFRYGRLVRVIRVLRILRAIRSVKVLLTFVLRSRMQGTFSLVAAMSIILMIFGAVGILEFERGAEGSNINNAIDALWWSFVTMTTVGYGDYYPVTSGGRVIATMLMISGVGLFGTFTGFVASWFVEEESSKDDQQLDELKQQITKLSHQMNELKAVIEQQKCK
ncbi:ion transporter [Vibrio agarivorans]|uniref:ion transporter n=1 Tax=Vibrio agarivorans TaxID=153622 RepID=UPI00223192A6|nr:ion transporter [Vibrio agarivorans]MDN3662792.1 ion transporter [Vibrio agarivorans]